MDTKTYAIISNDFNKFSFGKNENEKPYITLKRNLLEIIWTCHCNGITDFYVNCEYGIPLWSAEIICALKKYNNIHLHIAVPYEEQCLNWYENLRDRYYLVHAAADSVKFSSRHYTDTCYQEADEIMADKSDTIIIFGNQFEKPYIAGYAEQTGKHVKYVYTNKMII